MGREVTEQDFENNAMNLMAEAFPLDFRNQEQREGDRLREFLVSQLLDYRPKPNRPVFEDE